MICLLFLVFLDSFNDKGGRKVPQIQKKETSREYIDFFFLCWEERISVYIDEKVREGVQNRINDYEEYT